jgi:two-component system, LytTR family, sensor kinase
MQSAQVLGPGGAVVRMPWKDVFLDSAGHFVWWLLLTPLLIALVGRFPFTPGTLGRSFSVHVAASLLVAIAVCTLRVIVPSPLIPRATLPWWPLELRNLRSWLPQELAIYWLVLAILVAIDSYRRFIRIRQEASELNAQLAAAELAMLRMQLEPHFLFNALNGVATLIDWRPADARRMISLLGSLLRESFAFDGRPLVALEEELEWIDRYLEIEQLRFEDRLTIRMEVAPDTFDALVPSFILQPLVENAMKHGVARAQAPVAVTLTAQRMDGRLRISVSDDGVGMATPTIVEGVGLRNTRKRLRTLYGDDQDLQILSSAKGVNVTVELPYSVPSDHGSAV